MLTSRVLVMSSDYSPLRTESMSKYSPTIANSGVEAALRRSTMRDIAAELKQLRLDGMAGPWQDLIEQGASCGPDLAR
jgi:hypothetical protein